MRAGEHPCSARLGYAYAGMHPFDISTLCCRHGYLAELPAQEYLPVFWTAPERALLQGTEREDAPAEDAALMHEDYEEHVLPLVEQYPERLRAGDFTPERFMVAASWVASRAFGVDSHHGVHNRPVLCNFDLHACCR